MVGDGAVEAARQADSPSKTSGEITESAVSLFFAVTHILSCAVLTSTVFCSSVCRNYSHANVENAKLLASQKPSSLAANDEVNACETRFVFVQFVRLTKPRASPGRCA